jgi:L-aspartate oxidase
LASNSLLEGLVFAKKASMSILKDNNEKIFEEFEVENEIMSYKEDKAKKNELRQIMWQDVSIMRTKNGLFNAKDKIALLLKQNIGKLLKFRLLTAKEIVNRAISRDKSIGVHTIQEEE